MHHNNFFPNSDLNWGNRGMLEQQQDHQQYDFNMTARNQDAFGNKPYQEKTTPRKSNSPGRQGAQMNYTSRSIDLLQNKFPGSEDELIKLFEESESEIAFWKTKFERESEKSQRLQANLNELHLELEEKEERVKALTTINKNLKDKLSGSSFGENSYQYMGGDNKALMDKIRDQSLQIEELIQKNEVFNKQIENLRRNKTLSHDYSNYDIGMSDNRKKERELLDKISQLSMEMESMKLKHAQEKNELVRNINHGSPYYDGGYNNLVRTHQKDQSFYENNIDRLNKNISNLQSLNSGLKNDRLRELLEDINEMKKEMQRYGDSRNEQSHVTTLMMETARKKDSEISDLNNKIFAMQSEIQKVHLSYQREKEALMLQGQSLRVDLESKNAKIGQLQQELMELSDHVSHLENEYRIKEKFINDLTKRNDYNEESMKKMAAEYKNHIEHVYNIQSQSYNVSNEEIWKLKEQNRELILNNEMLRKEKEENVELANKLKERNRRLVQKLNIDTGGEDIYELSSDNEYPTRSRLPKKDRSATSTPDNLILFKEKRDRLAYLCRLGSIINSAFFQGVQNSMDELTYSRLFDSNRVQELIGKSEKLVLNEVSKNFNPVHQQPQVGLFPQAIQMKKGTFTDQPAALNTSPFKKQGKYLFNDPEDESYSQQQSNDSSWRNMMAEMQGLQKKLRNLELENMRLKGAQEQTRKGHFDLSASGQNIPGGEDKNMMLMTNEYELREKKLIYEKNLEILDIRQKYEEKCITYSNRLNEMIGHYNTYPEQYPLLDSIRKIQGDLKVHMEETRILMLSLQNEMRLEFSKNWINKKQLNHIIDPTTLERGRLQGESLPQPSASRISPFQRSLTPGKDTGKFQQDQPMQNSFYGHNQSNFPGHQQSNFPGQSNALAINQGLQPSHSHQGTVSPFPNKGTFSGEFSMNPQVSHHQSFGAPIMNNSLTPSANYNGGMNFSDNTAPNKAGTFQGRGQQAGRGYENGFQNSSLTSNIPQQSNFSKGYKIERPNYPLSGRILMRLIMAKSILGVEKGGKLSNAYGIVTIKGNHPKTDKTHIIDSLNPEWNMSYEYYVDKINKGQALPQMNIEIYDDNTLTGDDFLGDVANIDYWKVIENDGEWFDFDYPLGNSNNKKTKGKISGSAIFKLLFIPDSTTVFLHPDFILQAPNLFAINQKSLPINGKFLFHLVRAKNVAADESKTSDAYVKITFLQDIKESKAITSLNPEWNQHFEWPLNITTAIKNQLPLKLEVFDYDRFSSDEYLGETRLFDASIAAANPNRWIEIEDPLNNPSKKKLNFQITGTLLFRIMFLTHNAYPSPLINNSDQFKPLMTSGVPGFEIQRSLNQQQTRPFQDLSSISTKGNHQTFNTQQSFPIQDISTLVSFPVQGSTHILVQKAVDLPIIRTNGMQPNAIARILFESQEDKTTIITNSNPEWKQNFAFQTRIQGAKNIPKPVIEIWDQLNTNDFEYLGGALIPIEPCLTTPGSSNDVQLPLSNLHNKPLNHDITGSVFLRLNFIPDSKSLGNQNSSFGDSSNTQNMRQTTQQHSFNGNKNPANLSGYGMNQNPGNFQMGTMTQSQTLPVGPGTQANSNTQSQSGSQLKNSQKGGLYGSKDFSQGGSNTMGGGAILGGGNNNHMGGSMGNPGITESNMNNNYVMGGSNMKGSGGNLLSNKQNLNPQMTGGYNPKENSLPPNFYPLRGKIRVEVISASNIIAADKGSSDAFARVVYNNERKYDTKIITDLNPNWSETFEIAETDIKHENEIPFYYMEVYDKNTNWNDEFLGECFDIDIKDCLFNPGKWMEYEKALTDNQNRIPKGKKVSGKIHFRTIFIAESGTMVKSGGMQGPNQLGKNIAPVNQTISFPMEGNFDIKVTSASNILGVEDQGKLSNAFAKVVFDKAEKKTKIIDSINPTWNETFSFKKQMQSEKQLPSIFIEIWDDNTIMSNEFLGDVNPIDIRPAILNSGKWIDYDEKIGNSQGKKTKGKITGNLVFHILFVPVGSSDPSQKSLPDEIKDLSFSKKKTKN